MIQRIGRKRFSVYAYDVESHNDDESVANDRTSIWLSALINEDSKEEDENCYLYSIDAFLDRLERMTDKHRSAKERPVSNIAIYVYNLSFEWSFILPVLLKRGIVFKENILPEDSYVFNSVTNKSCSSVWNITIKFAKKGGVVVFKDLCKLFPGGLGFVAKSFNLPTQKGEIDYRLNRLRGHVITAKEKHYNFFDCRIIVDILLEMQRKNDPDFWKASSTASYSARKMIKRGWPHAFKPMLQFRKWYPLLGEKESEFLRNGVAGGITYATPAFQFKEISQELIHIDAHQMHPTQIYQHLFPYGEGLYFKGAPPTDHIYISCVRIKVSYAGVKLHSIIKLIGVDFIDGAEITIWDFEIPTMRKCYEDLRIEYLDGYAYRVHFLPWREYCHENYELRKKAKKEHDDFNIMFRKLLNNAGAFGKLIEHGHEIVFENYITDDFIPDSKEHKKDNASINATYTYIPVGSAVPARSRVDLIEAALKMGWKNIVYFDTDSIFAVKNEETLKALEGMNFNDELGGWGRENDILMAQFTAPKRYKLLEIVGRGDNFLMLKTEAHLAGINFGKTDSAPSFEDLNITSRKYQIQGTRRCKGGTLIIFKEKEIGVLKKYESIYERNVDGDGNEDDN